MMKNGKFLRKEVIGVLAPQSKTNGRTTTDTITTSGAIRNYSS